MDIYIVQPKDTIYSIAAKYKVSAIKLIQYNELENPNDLVTGQTIVIVFPKQVYTVQNGDTLISIANAFNVSLMQLLRNNPFLSTSKIYPGLEIIISYNTTEQLISNGYAYPYINTEILKKTLPSLTYISIYNYRAKRSGEIISYYDDSKIVELSKNYGTIPLLLVTTLSPLGEPDILTSFNILLSTDLQEVHINQIINIIKTQGYYGVNLVFNYINTITLPLYQSFITNVSNRLQQEGLLIFLTINTNTKYDNNQIKFEKVDYSIFYPVVDQLLFLQFVWSINYGPPSPVSSIHDIKILMNEVMSTVPADKIVVGSSLISYDWTLPYIQGISYAHSLTPTSAINLARIAGTTIQFDDISQTPFFIYEQLSNSSLAKHIIWSIDARTISALVQLISELELKGVGLWNIMSYFPQLWLVINSQYEIVKLLPENLSAIQI